MAENAINKTFEETSGAIVADVSFGGVDEVDFKNTYSWKDINVYTKSARTGEGREIKVINNFSGEVRFGQILAIMGSSGAGKTTFLNAVSARDVVGFRVEGTLAVNGRVTDFSSIRALSAYVQQESIFLSNLTVREHLYFQAHLRMNVSSSWKERSERVDELLLQFNLTSCSDVYIGGIRRRGISGGEQKLLSIATEIIGNAPILFLDEPTTGLDVHRANKVMNILQKLKSTGQTIISTVHQPSSELFIYFDELLLICGGRVAFMGKPSDANEFFASQGFPVPKYFNPADSFIRTLAIDSSNLQKCIERNETLCDAYLASPFAKDVFIDTTKPHIVAWQYKASFWMQLFVVFYRAGKNNVREHLYWILWIYEFITAALYAYLFSHYEMNQTGVNNINNSIFVLAFALTNQLCFVETRMFFEDVLLIYREIDANLYSVTAYYWGFTLASIPYQISCAVLFPTVFYFVVGYGGDVTKFVNYLLTCIVASQSFMSLVYCICGLFLDMIVCLKVTILLSNLLVILSGTMVNFATIPTAFQWLKYVSIPYLTNEALDLNQWEKVQNISCKFSRAASKTVIFYNTSSESHNCLDNGIKVIDRLNYRLNAFESNIGLLFVYFFIFRVIANIILCLRLKRK